MKQKQLQSSEKIGAVQKIVDVIGHRIESGVIGGTKLLTYGVVVATILQIVEPAASAIVIPVILQDTISRYSGTVGTAILTKLIDKVGGDMLVGVIDRIASRREISNDDIFDLLERDLSAESIQQSLEDALHSVDIITATTFLTEMENLARRDRRSQHTLLKLLSEIRRKLNASSAEQGKILHNTEQILAKLPNPQQYISFGYRNRIQNFIDEYIGTSTNPVPFGGRRDVLNNLTQWAKFETNSQRLLMVANAGRGKSALLVRWVQWLQGHSDFTVVFVPISIRFDTALRSVTFAALAHQLAAIYGERINSPNFSADEWHEMCLSYLRREPPDGKKLIVIVDGLDEAADWEASATLFPSQLPAAIKLLVSARILSSDRGAEGWLSRLNWNNKINAHIVELPELSKDDIRDALTSMGNPLAQIVPEDELLTELHRLTEGDPLLIRLYIEAIQSSIDTEFKLDVEALKQLDPGISGYIARWWEEQERQWRSQGVDPLAKREMIAFLHLCATAMGPLKYDDLKVLASEIFTSSLQVKRIARMAKRIFVGDGRSQGFVFSHSRFNQYFWEEMSIGEQANWESRFVSYGMQIVEQIRSKVRLASDTPSYVVQFFGAHLVRKGVSLDDLVILTSDEWYQATTATTGTHSVFLNDVKRVWTVATKSYHPSKNTIDAQTVGEQIRCALITSSLRSVAANISADLIYLLVESGIWTATQAIIHIQQKPTPKERVTSIAVLCPLLDMALRDQVLATALNDVALVENSTLSRGDVLAKLIPHLPETLLPKANQYVNEMGWLEAYPVIRALEMRYAKAGMYDEAIWLIQTHDRHTRIVALTELLPLVDNATKQLIQNGLSHLQRFAYRRQARLELLIASLTDHPVNMRQKIAEECLALAEKSTFQTNLLTLWPYLTQKQREHLISQLIEKAKITKQPQDQKRILEDLISYLEFTPDSIPFYLLGIVKRNETYFEPIHERIPDFALHGKLLARLATLGFEKEAIQKASEIYNKYARIGVLCAVVPPVSAEDRSPLVQQVLTLLAQVVGKFDFCKRILFDLASHLSSVQIEQAVTIVSEFEYESIRAEIYTHLAKYARGTLRRELLRLALASSQTIDDTVWQVYPLVEAGKAIGNAEQKDIAFLSAYERAAEIKRPDMRIRSMGYVAPHLNEPLKHQAFQDCLDTTRHNMRAADVNNQFKRIVRDIPPELIDEAFRVAEVSQNNIRWHLMINVASRKNIEFQEGVGQFSLHHSASHGEHLQAQFIWGEASKFAPVTRDKALEIARTVRIEPAGLDGSLRINAMTALAYQYPDKQRDQIISELLDMVRTELGDDMWLIVLSQNVNAVVDMEDEAFRQVVLNATYAMQDAASRAVVMTRIARFYEPTQADNLYQEVLKLCHQLDHFHNREVLIQLAHQLPIDMLDRVLTLADEYVNFADNKISILLSVAFRATEPSIKVQLFAQAANLIVGKQRRYSSREGAWLDWLTLSEQIQIEDVYIVWQSVLSRIGNRIRHNLLFDLWHLMPAIERFGGKSAVEKVATSIVEICERWR